jgi:hypothetical protein
VDVTWDPPLAGAGFPVTAWDGASDMPLAVTDPGEMLVAATVEKKLGHVRYLQTRPEHDAGTLSGQGEYLAALARFNTWFDSFRQ